MAIEQYVHDQRRSIDTEIIGQRIVRLPPIVVVHDHLSPQETALAGPYR